MVKKDKVLRPVHPNAGIKAAYHKALLKALKQMHASILYWVKAAYRQNEPILAQDASPFQLLTAAIRKLVRRWTKRFNDLAPQLARWFSQSVSTRSDQALMAMLKKAGFAIEFQQTKAMKQVAAATVKQNVALIKSIPQKYLGQVEQLVMQSVQQGRKLDDLTDALQKQFKVSRKRAELIARDQNNKATSAFNRVRQLESGFEEAIWMHSHAGKKPRPTHVAMDGKKYSVRKGMWDSHEKAWVQPGQLINCRCSSRIVIPGFNG